MDPVGNGNEVRIWGYLTPTPWWLSLEKNGDQYESNPVFRPMDVLRVRDVLQ